MSDNRSRRALISTSSESYVKQIPLCQPLSLQQTTILYVFTNLELFPPDMLALLPLKFRRDLLLLLPPADIFQLEQTSVVDGIDMENEVWKVVCERYDFGVVLDAHIDIEPDNQHSRTKRRNRFQKLRPFALPKVIQSKESVVSLWKGTLLSFILAFLLHMQPFVIYYDYSSLHARYTSFAKYRNYIVFLQLLFSTQFFTLRQISHSKGFQIRVIDIDTVIARHAAVYHCDTGPVQLSEWTNILFTKYCQAPLVSEITIEEQFFTLHKKEVTVEMNLLQTLFGRVECLNLHLYCSGYGSPTLGDPSQLGNAIEMLLWVFDVISSCGQTPLKSIKLTGHVAPSCNTDCIRIISQDTYKFEGVLRKVFVSTTDYPINNCLHALQNVSIVGSESHDVEITLTSFFSLLLVINRCPVLKTFNVSGILIRYDQSEHEAFEQRLKGTYSSCLLPQSCTSITLNHITQLPLSTFFWVLQLFLYSPSTEPQTLTVSHCLLNYEPNNEDEDLKVSDMKHSEKFLQLSYLDFTPIFLNRVSRLPSIVLKNLKLEEFTYKWTDEVGLVEFFRASFFNRPIRQLETLTYDISIDWQSDKRVGPRVVSEVDALFIVLTMLPETVVTLHCLLSSDQAPSFFSCLVQGWKKNSGGRKLKKLIVKIVVISGYSTITEGSIRSYLSVLASAHQVDMVTNSLDLII